MDMLEQSLDTASQEKQEEEVVQASEDGTGEEQTAVTIASVQQAAAFGDHNIQYQFRTEGGQVTYRVVQVTDQHLEGRDDGGGAVSVVSTAAFTGAPQAVAQAVIQNPFSNGGSPAGEAVGGETRFAYFPATAVSDGTVSVQAAADPTLTQAGATGQFYVMMTPPDVIQAGTPRTIAPRTQPYPALCFSPGILPRLSPEFAVRVDFFFFFKYHSVSRIFILAHPGWPVFPFSSKIFLCCLSLKLTTCIIIIMHQKGIHLRLSPTVSHTLVIAVIKIISRLT
ncbi:upstream stimulatory factor 2 isoform X3 [Lates calcarifer]|uniref:Upstream stimulatory factor 2 isoform X3 n=1 Tax=Lates calcarifer TaxID=8187 RepID=A0AAJ8BIB7_LATCA|nr:upstream stimulatory factor 2 isoform X3 [Lates calcarifer]